jgi:uncharacterized protein (DUF427 family)
MVIQATWKGAVIAESDRTIMVEGNHYFPAESVRRDHLRPSSAHTACPWKGTASYYDLVVDGEVNREAAWYYPSPTPAAQRIAGYVAFWHGVRVRAAAPAPERDEPSLTVGGEPTRDRGSWLRRLVGR